jgi:Sec-independent protein translocase protein TatA
VSTAVLGVKGHHVDAVLSLSPSTVMVIAAVRMLLMGSGKSPEVARKLGTAC